MLRIEGQSSKSVRPEEQDQYGSWMLFQRVPRRAPTRAKGAQTKQVEPKSSEPDKAIPKGGVGNQRKATTINQEQNRNKKTLLLKVRDLRR